MAKISYSRLSGRQIENIKAYYDRRKTGQN
jgi:hypothetical protein